MSDSDSTCSIEDCEKPAYRRVWCSMHYSRWHRHGEPGEAQTRVQPRDPDATEAACKKCGETKPISEFRKNRHTCRSCRKEEKREWDKRSPEKISEAAARSYQKHKEKRKGEARQWYWSNPERTRASRKQYYKRNKNFCDALSRRWKAANPEKVRESARQENKKRVASGYFAAYYRKRRAEDPEALRDCQREWRKRNPEKNRASGRKWRKNNPEKVAKKTRVRLSRKASAPGDGATLSELKAIHGKSCYICKVTIADTVDHVIPLSKGGTNYPLNLKPACNSCNAKKGNKIGEEYGNEPK